MKVKKIIPFIIICFAFISTINAQYYSGISTSSPTFVTDLQTLIRSNYVKKSYDSYDENMIPGFYAQDNGDGTNSVFGVYSGYEYVYSGTFTWGTMSREHTWCYSWMPSYPSTSTNEYSDYHHLFPVNQNKANGVRSNHPLGVVQTISSQFLDGKIGTNSVGDIVYEPRDEQKGNSARALLYMSLKYNGIGGNDWTFNHLNTVTLPGLSEGAQDLQTLLDWNTQDPPDSAEEARNDYIYNLQHNRNPFIDHPEYINYIDFNTLTKIDSEVVPEPSNHVLNFSATSDSYGQITLTWNNNDGVNQPSGYLIKTSSVSYAAITAPADGAYVATDLDISDGSGSVNILYPDSSYSWSSLSSSITYYFKIYPYSNSGNNIDYKTDGTIPSTDAVPSSLPPFSELLITKYIEGSSNNKALEIYNITGSSIDLSALGYKLELYFNGNSTSTTTINLTGTIANASTFVIANSSAFAGILAVADMTTGSLSFNGNDAVVLKKGTTVIDAIGQIGFDPGTEWGSGLTSTADNTLHRKHGTTGGDTNPNDAFDPAVEWDGFATDDITGLGESDPLPVELTSFTANVLDNFVVLNWETATEVNNYGFEIQRASFQKDGTTPVRTEFNKIGFVQGHGNSNSPKLYSFTDNSVVTGKYSYRLKQIDVDGKFEYSDVVNVTIGAPDKFELLQNYPNPFNPTTQISFTLPIAAKVNLSVYNTIGQKVAELANGNFEAGVHTVRFNAVNFASGMYFYKLTSGNFVQINKMMLLK